MNEIIIGKLNRIEAKLDALIKALHDYDEGTLHCEYSGLPSVEAYSDEEYGESSFEAFMDTRQSPCAAHDAASWDEEEAERRMNIIGQNGNEGLHYDSHYVTNEEADEDAATFNDYEMRVGKDNNTQDKHVGEDKKRNKRRYYKPKNK